MEEDQYTLVKEALPTPDEHHCTPSGIGYLVTEFIATVESRVRSDPLQPFPALYEDIRTQFTKKLKFDEKYLFLAEIPTYSVLQSRMYKIRRDYLPTAPTSQTDLNTSLEWFDIDSLDADKSVDDEEGVSSKESIVKGDKIHGDGLRVLMFATEESLKILARARTILGDETFCICPSLG